MTGDGRLLACSGMNLLCFDKNGTIAWIVPFQYTCRLDIAPVNDDRGKVDHSNLVLAISSSKMWNFNQWIEQQGFLDLLTSVTQSSNYFVVIPF